MKAITILQPYASLIACGAKHYETRSWPTKYRGRIAIHAGLSEEFDYMLADNEIKNLLIQGGMPNSKGYVIAPHGYVVATADLVDCLQVIEQLRNITTSNRETFEKAKRIAAVLENKDEISHFEGYFGNFELGRYAWKLENVEMLKVPIPAKGQQGLWNFNYDDTEK